MRKALGFSVLLVLLIALFPAVSSACYQGEATAIQSITPQVGIAGITRVYVLGHCFGATQGGGSISVGGVQVPADHTLLWSDGELMFVLPDNAQTGDLAVTSASGTDNSANESNCLNWGWCGTGVISGSFTVYTPNNPTFEPNLVDTAGPRAPEYVEGTWNFDDGYGDTATYTLSQGSQSGGQWPVSGQVHWSYCYGQCGTCSQQITGALDASGNLTMNVGNDIPDGCGGYSDEFVILGSGDMTSQGYFYDDPHETAPPIANFPNNLGNEATGGEVLVKATVLPGSETPSFVAWVAVNGSADPTYAAWERTLPLSSDNLVEFSGRFVFEQAGQVGIDSCHDAAVVAVGVNNVPYSPFTEVTGGGWYVNTSGIWGSGQAPGGGFAAINSDDIGAKSDAVQWYQNHLPPGACYMTVYQTMKIDTASGPATYNADGNGPSNVLQIEISNSPFRQVCTSVTPTVGISPGSECKNYPQ